VVQPNSTIKIGQPVKRSKVGGSLYKGEDESGRGRGFSMEKGGWRNQIGKLILFSQRRRKKGWGHRGVTVKGTASSRRV